MQWRYKVCALGLLFLAATVNAERNENYKWNGETFFASSTSGLELIIPNGNEVTFFLLGDVCINDRNNDCGRDILRNQLQQKYGLRMNKPLIYKFSIKEDQSYGTPLKIWEIKPFGGEVSTVPTISIDLFPGGYVEVDVKWSNDDGWDTNKVRKRVDFLSEGWNHFEVQTFQSPQDNGYVIVELNGHIVFEYYGQTSYAHRFPLQYWIGPYICCGHQENEPDHVLSYKNVASRIGLKSTKVKEIPDEVKIYF